MNDQTSENYPAVGNQKHDYKETEKKVIWLGDSRTRRIAEYLDTDIMFLYKSGAKCKILKEKWIPKIENILNKNPDKIVVIALGNVDCINGAGEKADPTEYCKVINSLVEKYPETEFYYVYPYAMTYDYTTKTTGRTVQASDFNKTVHNFNLYMNQRIKAHAIKLDYYLGNDFTTEDGLHPDKESCQKIYDYIMKEVNREFYITY